MNGARVDNERGHITIDFSPTLDASSGVRMRLNKSTRTISVYGWYDDMVGIPGGSITLEELTGLFGKPKEKGRSHKILKEDVGNEAW